METSTQQSGGQLPEVEVLRWRFDELRRAGFTSTHAQLIAADAGIDLHVATGLLRKGCPENLAVQILR